MKNFQMNIIALAIIGLALTSCSTNMSKSNQTAAAGSSNQITELSGAPVRSGPVAGSDGAMDELDKSKLYHALDGGIGKSTSWDNVATGTEYTVVPTEKVTLSGNPYCRKYTVTSVRNNNSRQITGTACVSSDGAWHPA